MLKKLKAKKIIAYIYVVVFLCIAVFTSCSDTIGGDGNIVITMSNMPLLQTAENHGNGTGWERADCFSCHPIPDTATHPRLIVLPGLTEEEACMSCHLDNGVGDSRFRIPQCIACHTGSGFNEPVLVTGVSIHTVSGAFASSMSDIDCVICHDSVNMDGVINYDDLSPLNSWDRGNINNFCFTCHSAAGTIAQGMYINGADIESAYAVDYHGERTTSYINIHLRDGNSVGTVLSCVSCHRQHSSSNRSLFIQTGAELGTTDPDIQNAAVTLTSIYGDDLRDLCVLCHGDDNDPNSIAAPNGMNQVLHQNACQLCHATSSLGYRIYSTMMTNGNFCDVCHRHGANDGTADTRFPSGSVHSRF